MWKWLKTIEYGRRTILLVCHRIPRMIVVGYLEPYLQKTILRSRIMCKSYLRNSRLLKIQSQSICKEILGQEKPSWWIHSMSVCLLREKWGCITTSLCFKFIRRSTKSTKLRPLLTLLDRLGMSSVRILMSYAWMSSRSFIFQMLWSSKGSLNHFGIISWSVFSLQIGLQMIFTKMAFSETCLSLSFLFWKRKPIFLNFKGLITDYRGQPWKILIFIR